MFYPLIVRDIYIPDNGLMILKRFQESCSILLLIQD